MRERSRRVLGEVAENLSDTETPIRTAREDDVTGIIRRSRHRLTESWITETLTDMMETDS